MMRSMVACMGPSPGSSSAKLGRLKLGDRQIGKSDPVDFAALKQLHNYREQPLVDRNRIGNRAGTAQIIRGDVVGVAYHLFIQDANATFNQHGPYPSNLER